MSSFSKEDKQFMQLALAQAKLALDAGDFPVGAALILNGELLGVRRNSLFSDNRTDAHAEHNLLTEKSEEIRNTIRGKKDYSLTLYTTLEPCLMCLGTAILHRVSRIVIACPDPTGGTININRDDLGSFYQRVWASFEMGLEREASYDLIVQFLKTGKFKSWKEMLTEFEELKAIW